MATRLLRFVATGTGPQAGGPFPDLTDRERDILRLLTQGCTNTEVADRLGLTSSRHATPAFRPPDDLLRSLGRTFLVRHS